MPIIEQKIPNISLPIQSHQAIFDIETTGFRRDSDTIFLIGIAREHFLMQWLCTVPSPEEEKRILQKAVPLLKDTEMITYNGDGFDLPFLNARAAMHGIALPSFRSLDLLTMLRQKRNFLTLPDLRLKTVEKAAGIVRRDSMSGKEVAASKKHLADDESLQEKVLMHNQEDLIHTGELVPFLHQIQRAVSFSISFDPGEEKDSGISSPDSQSRYRIRLERFQLEKDFAFLSLSSSPSRRVPLYFTDSFVSLEWEDNQLRMRIPVHKLKKGENLLFLAVSPEKSADQSAFALPAPFLVLQINKQADALNLLQLAQDSLTHIRNQSLHI